jgi:hypothetical protein
MEEEEVNNVLDFLDFAFVNNSLVSMKLPELKKRLESFRAIKNNKRDGESN